MRSKLVDAPSEREFDSQHSPGGFYVVWINGKRVRTLNEARAELRKLVRKQKVKKADREAYMRERFAYESPLPPPRPPGPSLPTNLGRGTSQTPGSFDFEMLENDKRLRELNRLGTSMRPELKSTQEWTYTGSPLDPTFQRITKSTGNSVGRTYDRAEVGRMIKRAQKRRAEDTSRPGFALYRAEFPYKRDPLENSFTIMASSSDDAADRFAQIAGYTSRTCPKIRDFLVSKTSADPKIVFRRFFPGSDGVSPTLRSIIRDYTERTGLAKGGKA